MAGGDRIFRKGGPRSGEPSTPGEIARELHGAPPATAPAGQSADPPRRAPGEMVRLRTWNGDVHQVPYGSAEWQRLISMEQAVEVLGEGGAA
ncbi:MAG: hypothetical protein U0R70_08825 [Solirubrobacteraceae bacterium]